MKFFDQQGWPTPAEWQRLLGPEKYEEIIEDAETIIREGRVNQGQITMRKKKEKKNGKRSTV